MTQRTQERRGSRLVEGTVEVEAKRHGRPHRLSHGSHATEDAPRGFRPGLELQASVAAIHEAARLAGGDLRLGDAHEGIDRHVRGRHVQEAQGCFGQRRQPRARPPRIGRSSWP